MQRVCKNCGKEFAHVNSTRGMFCSFACYNAYRKTSPPEYRVLEMVDLICQKCGTAFKRRRHEIRGKRQFCSRSCAASANGAANGKAPHRPAVEKICEYCGTTYKIKASHSQRRRFCSNICNLAYRSDYMFGANNPNHRHGQNQNGARYIAMRRFANECIICGWNISTDIHHIVPKSQGGTNEPSNLAVLCPNHHRMAKMELLTTVELQARVQELMIESPTLRPRAQRAHEQ